MIVCILVFLLSRNVVLKPWKTHTDLAACCYENQTCDKCWYRRNRFIPVPVSWEELFPFLRPHLNISIQTEVSYKDGEGKQNKDWEWEGWGQAWGRGRVKPAMDLLYLSWVKGEAGRECKCAASPEKENRKCRGSQREMWIHHFSSFLFPFQCYLFSNKNL